VRCYRYLLTMTALVAFLIVAASLLSRALLRGLPYLHSLGAIILLAVLAAALVTALAALRGRAIVDSQGVTIVGAFRRWRYEWKPPAAGKHTLTCRATNTAGDGQVTQLWNRSGYARNVYETLTLNVS